MRANLPMEVLRSFVAIVDQGSMLKASERVFLSQSAVSLQVKRLEDMLQQSLFLRDGRRLVLTPAGETFLSYARRLLDLNDEAVLSVAGELEAGPVRIGMVQDFAEDLLTGALSDFAALHPEAHLQAKVAGTKDLLAARDQGQLDIVLGFDEAPAADPLRVEPMIWIGDPALFATKVIPLAVLEAPCRFRDAAVAALGAAGLSHRIAIETPNLATLRAGVNAGLGLSVRTPVLSGVNRLAEHEVTPPLPHVATRIWTGKSLSKGAERLVDILKLNIAIHRDVSFAS